jgi:hypothetical protein
LSLTGDVFTWAVKLLTWKINNNVKTAILIQLFMNLKLLQPVFLKIIFPKG